MKRRIVTFVILTFMLSSPGYLATIISGETSLLLLAGPALAALITRSVFYRNLRGFGWRLPGARMALAAYVVPILVSGPMFVLAWLLLGYYTTDNTDTGVAEGLISAASVGFLTVMAWLTLYTRSLWPAVILHGSQNAITQNFFSEYTSQEGNAAYYVSEVGALIAIAWIAAALAFWHHRHRIPDEGVPAGVTVTKPPR